MANNLGEFRLLVALRYVFDWLLHVAHAMKVLNAPFGPPGMIRRMGNDSETICLLRQFGTSMAALATPPPRQISLNNIAQ